MKNFSYTVLPVFMPIPTKFRLSRKSERSLTKHIDKTKGEPTSRRSPSLNLNAKTKSKQKTQIMIMSFYISSCLFFWAMTSLALHKAPHELCLRFTQFIKFLW